VTRILVPKRLRELIKVQALESKGRGLGKLGGGERVKRKKRSLAGKLVKILRIGAGEHVGTTISNHKIGVKTLRPLSQPQPNRTNPGNDLGGRIIGVAERWAVAFSYCHGPREEVRSKRKFRTESKPVRQP